MILRLLLLHSILLPLAILAQHTPISFRNIGINDGLSQSSVVAITMDKAGFIWLATQDGLNRYDGNEFGNIRRNFDDITTPTSSRLGKISCYDNGELWLLTSGGRLEKLNLYTGKIETITRLGADSIPLPPLTCFLHDSNHDLWMGTEKEGIFFYHSASGLLTHYPSASPGNAQSAPNAIQSFFEDKKGQIWMLTNNGLHLLQSHTGQWRQFLTHADNKEHIPCSTMDQDKEGNYWLGTFGKGLYWKRPTDSLFTPFKGFSDTARLPAGLVIESVMTDRNGDTWVGTYGNGLFILSPHQGTIRHYTADNKDPFALAYNDVLCIKEDNDGGIWIGTDGGGISHYDKRLNNFLLFSKYNVPANTSIEQVRSITTDTTGGVWIGTSNNGLTYTHPHKNAFYTLHFPPYNKQLNNYDRIVSLLTDKTGDIWVGTQGNGLLILDSRTRTIKKRFYPGAAPLSIIPDHTIWCMLPDTGDRIWVGTRNAGLCLLDKHTGLVANFNSENNVRTLTRLNDSIICVGFEKEGVRLLNTHTHTFHPPQLSLDGERKTILKCTWYKPPFLWIGTLSNGLIAWNINTGDRFSITEKQGLPNNTIYSIIPDRQGALWMSSNRGIFRFTPPADLLATDRTNFTLFTMEDGLQSNEFNTGAGFQDPNGKIFFGGINGLTIFDPSAIANIDHPASVAITRISINNKPLETDTGYAYLKKLVLPYSGNSFSFNFAALDYAGPGRFDYYYQLLGYDQNWIDAGNRNYAAYTNLQPGHYTLQIKASLHLSGREDPITTLSIIIRPPFWMTGWFIALCALSLIGIGYAGYQYRIRQLLKVQQIRHRIAADLHDDIGSTLTNISMLSELSRKNLPDQDQADLFLHRIGEEVQHSSQALDDIVWSINTNNDTIEQTVARMRRYVAEIFDAANINYTIEVDDTFGHKKLNMEQRRDFFLVFKEVINNIYKHAGASNVYIGVWLEKQQLYLEVWDDGIGFDPLSTTHRNGIKNINNRMQKWKGMVTIKSGAGNGSLVRVRLPVL